VRGLRGLAEQLAPHHQSQRRVLINNAGERA
jgi:hypothetical protein